MLAKVKKACPFHPPHVDFGTVVSALLVVEVLPLLELCSCYAMVWVEKQSIFSLSSENNQEVGAFLAVQLHAKG